MAQHRRSLLNIKRSRLAALAARPAPASQKPKVAITDVTATPVQEPAGGRTYVILQLKTDAGVTGVGETRAREPRLLTQQLDLLKPQLVGKDAISIEAMRRLMMSGTGAAPEREPLQAALNMAMLDVLGKLSQAPVYEVLRGATRQKARAFAHLHGHDEASLKDSLEKAKSAGYRAFQVPLTMPQGPTKGRAFYRETYALLEKLRAAGGTGTELILDCGAQLAAAEAVGMAIEFERFHLLWLEEPTAELNGGAFRKISSESVTPVGYGRNITDNAGFQDLLRMDSIDILRPDIARTGISQVRKAASLAETYYVAIAPFHRGGPIGTAAALHAAASLPNFFIQEVPLPADERDTAMRRELAGVDIEKPQDGFLPLPSGHGLGVTLNEDALRKYALRS